MSNALSYQSDRTFRDRVFGRDGYKCRMCGATRSLEVHHIIPQCIIGRDELRTFVPNGMVLCHRCHLEYGRAYQANHLPKDLTLNEDFRKALHFMCGMQWAIDRRKLK